MGSDQAQGFYFARPMDVEAATAHLVGHTTLSLWVGHSGHELEVIKSVIADFEVANPGLRVEVTGGVSGDRIMAALAGGTVAQRRLLVRVATTSASTSRTAVSSTSGRT